MITKAEQGNIFLRMHPLQRIVLSLLTCAIIYFILPENTPKLLAGMLLWDVFLFSYLILCWVVLLKRSVPQIRQMAKKDDGSKAFVFALVLISSFASLITVLFLMLSQRDTSSKNYLYLPVAFAGMLFSWLMVHSTFAFHYAHMYYDDDENNPGNDAQGLEFPGNNNLNYLDFAYFSFVIGCTFQVSDVEISSQKIRRVAFVHGLISFAINTIVVALTINLIAGLSK